MKSQKTEEVTARNSCCVASKPIEKNSDAKSGETSPATIVMSNTRKAIVPRERRVSLPLTRNAAEPWRQSITAHPPTTSGACLRMPLRRNVPVAKASGCERGLLLCRSIMVQR